MIIERDKAKVSYYAISQFIHYLTALKEESKEIITTKIYMYRVLQNKTSPCHRCLNSAFGVNITCHSQNIANIIVT